MRDILCYRQITSSSSSQDWFRKYGYNAKIALPIMMDGVLRQRLTAVLDKTEN